MRYCVNDTGCGNSVNFSQRRVIQLTLLQHRERENHQINERLRTLIVAYKTLGGS